MYVAVTGESAAGERRVALTPEGAAALIALGHRVGIEAGAGAYAQFPDRAYAEAGAEVVPPAGGLLDRADVMLKVRAPAEKSQRQGPPEVDRIRPGTIVVGLLDPLRKPEVAANLARRGIPAFSLDLVPRIARAQSMDALSSMSSVAGYRAVVTGAALCGRFFPLLMTAAGTEPPARVLILGAGVAGLQAIATARRLGALVHAFDTRPAARQQVESLGATFLGLPLPTGGAETAGGYAAQISEEEQEKERALLADAVHQADLVVTTALVPGGPAPVLVTREMVACMHPGAVVVDLAAEAGGNCAVTCAGERNVVGGVVVDGSCGPWDMPYTASRLYSRNMVAFLRHLFGAGLVAHAEGGHPADPDPNDPIIRETCVVWAGSVVHARVAERLGLAPGAVSAPRPRPAA